MRSASSARGTNPATFNSSSALYEYEAGTGMTGGITSPFCAR
jgi:hypothetical protein